MDDSDLEKIKNLLEGKLSPDEKNELARDPELLEEVRAFQDIDQALESIGLENLQSEINSWESDARNKEKLIRRRNLLGMAASVAILVAISFFIFRQDSSSTGELFAAHFEPYEDLITTRAPSEDVNLIRGMEAYNDKDYAKSAELLELHLTSEQPRIEARLYLAIAQMQLGENESSIKNLTSLTDHPLVGQQSLWYLALAHLSADQKQQAGTELKKIAEDASHYRQNAAREILDRL